MTAVVLLIPVLSIVSVDVFKRGMLIAWLCGTILILSAGIVCLYQGYRPARYLLAARFFRACGALCLVLGIHNILPLNLLTLFGVQMGSIIDVVLISFALADRINVMQYEKAMAQADAARASHLASLGELAASVAHEINTPVNTIINSADFILDDQERMDLERDVEVIKKEGRRIATIVRSLLFFARRPEKQKVPFAVGALLQGTFDMIGPELRKKNLVLTPCLAPQLHDVMVYPQQIEQVFLNVLTNALHALDERHGVEHDRKILAISAGEVLINERTFVRVMFQDNGIGISAPLLPLVKDSFVTTKKYGTGLGLTICRQIIDEHGGYILIESRVGENTKVSIDLPVATSA
jgi:signal transduction histidine kinase